MSWGVVLSIFGVHNLRRLSLRFDEIHADPTVLFNKQKEASELCANIHTIYSIGIHQLRGQTLDFDEIDTEPPVNN